VRFLLSIVLIIASVALLILDMTTPYAQAASPSAPNCVSAISSPVPGTSTPVSTPTAPGTLFINEVLTNPNMAWNCADLSPTPKDPSADTWVELYNAQNQMIELTTWHFNMSDTEGNNLTFTPPAASVIAAHGFLIVFPSIDLTQNTYALQLVIANTIIDSVRVPTLLPGQSYARIPDGSANWQVSNYPTIGASNRLNPPVPTPTPTKTKKTRIPRTKTPEAGRSSSRSYPTTVGSSTADSRTNDGLQPSWGAMQFPGGTASPSTVATVKPASTTPQQPENASDLPKKIVISVSGVILAGALLWCWKHFLSP
jgi:hypothetical protein